MSIIDTAAHSVVSYEAGKTKAFAGQRLSKVTWKTSNDKESQWYGIKRDSKAVSLPLVTSEEISGNLVALSPYVAEYLHGVQDKIVRARIEAGASSISMAEVSVAGILEYLEAEDTGTGARLTKESVGQWFDSEIAENLALVLMEKLGVSEVPTDAESAQILKVVDTFKEKVASLAGGKTSYDPKMAASLQKCVALAPAGDSLAGRFGARLQKMIDAGAGANLIDLL